MTIKEQVVKQTKAFRSTLEVIVAIIGSMVYLNHFGGEQIVSKDEFLINTTEIRLGQVEHELGVYQRIGLDKLDDMDKHRYELLLKQQEKLNEKRDSLLGL